MTANTYNLSPTEESYIRDLKITDPVLAYLEKKDTITFSKGDYLIKLEKHGEDKWVPETISYTSKITKKYICIHEDEHGVRYLKAFSSRGELLPYIFPLTAFTDSVKYELDPDYAEHMILADEDSSFNTMEIAKQKRKRMDAINRKNEKRSKRFQGTDDVIDFFKTTTIDTPLWWGYSLPDLARAKRKAVFKGYIKKSFYLRHSGGRVEMPVPQLEDVETGRTYTIEYWDGHVASFEEPLSYETE